MDLKDFYALKDGKAPLSVYDPKTKTRSVIDADVESFKIGEVEVPSGRLGASDPYVEIVGTLVFPVPAGKYPTYVTVADVSKEQDGSHYRECYLSVIFNDNEAVAVRGAAPETADSDDQDDNWQEVGPYYGVGVDAGMVGFFDAVEAEIFNASLEDPDDELFDHLEENLNQSGKGVYGVLYPENTKGNIVYSHSGWGDGFYPVMETVDKDGNLVGLHIDLCVLGTPETEED